jgi:hypothetical protein
MERVPLSAALDPTNGRLSSTLARHSFCVITDLPPSTRKALLRCDQEAEKLLTRSHRSGAKSKDLMRIRERGVGRTRLQSSCSKSLPLVGIGVHAVRSDARLQRLQLHLLTDVHALKCVPWPARQPALRPAIEQGAAELHSLATRLLSRLQEGGASIEAERAKQVGPEGDPSVFDCFVYPNADAEVVNMRAHTDPGLLTLTLASTSPGLQVQDRESSQWVDLEPSCIAGEDCLCLCGEALQISTGGYYEACLHRVRHADAPRVSSVFELRLTTVPPPPEGTAPTARRVVGAPHPRASEVGDADHSASADDDCWDHAAGERTAGLEYTLDFVRARLRGGSTPVEVLREFHVGVDACPPSLRRFFHSEATVSTTLPAAPASHGCDGATVSTTPASQGHGEVACEGAVQALAEFLVTWVSSCREREAVRAAFEAAEYVEVTPAFGDCTGRYVDMHF